MSNSPAPQLKRGLKNRHIQLIAMGGAIGTGLFLGSASVLQSAGPSMILGYAIGGFIAFLIMRQLGEMIVSEPVAGSFSHFAYRYWGKFPGFLAGWNYWVLYILVSMAELTAIGVYVQYWWPQIPTWFTALFFFIMVNLVNLTSVKIYGETEFWLSFIKIFAILAMIGFGAYLLISGNGGEQASIRNLWQYGGFFPNGFSGLIAVLAIIMFSFGGIELIGMTAAEAENPDKNIPKAINQVIYRILIFYIGALTILLSLYPWNQVAQGGSPFVMIFSQMGSTTAANALNIVVLTAALSVYTSSVYSNSRMLYGLAQQGNAPRSLLKLNRFGVPVAAIAVSAVVTFSCVIINYFSPKEALGFLMALVVSALVLNWAMISLTHIKFRQHLTISSPQPGQQLKFPALFYPYANYLCLGFVLFILAILLYSRDTYISVVLLPVWIALLWLSYKITLARR